MERHIPWFDRGLHKILWQGHTCNSIPATCWVKFQLVWICVSWSRDRMWRQVPPTSFLADIVLCCFVEKSIVRTKFISATCCIKFSWFEFVCHEAGTWCRSKPSDLAWFYEKIPCFGGQDFYSATCCSMKFSWFEFVHHEAGTWWPYHWHCPCHISSGIYVLAFITLL